MRLVSRAWLSRPGRSARTRRSLGLEACPSDGGHNGIDGVIDERARLIVDRLLSPIGVDNVVVCGCRHSRSVAAQTGCLAHEFIEIEIDDGTSTLPLRDKTLSRRDVDQSRELAQSERITTRSRNQRDDRRPVFTTRSEHEVRRRDAGRIDGRGPVQRWIAAITERQLGGLGRHQFTRSSPGSRARGEQPHAPGIHTRSEQLLSQRRPADVAGADEEHGGHLSTTSVLSHGQGRLATTFGEDSVGSPVSP